MTRYASKRHHGKRTSVLSSLGWAVTHPTRRASAEEIGFIVETIQTADGWVYDIVNMPDRRPYAVFRSRR